MKQLFVDIGNTRVKWCLAVEGTIVERDQFVWNEDLLTDSLTEHWATLAIPDEILISNVAGESVEKIIAIWCQSYWNKKVAFAKVTISSGGVTNSYADPSKLGIDRWLAMLAAWDIRKGKVCIIDCGSAITIDVLDAKGIHQGGMIAPGLALSGRALTDHTHALQANDRQDYSVLADNTEDAINSGCYHLFIGGVSHMVEKVQQAYGIDTTFIVTGGDAEYLLSELSVEMRYEPDLILRGLGLSSE